MIRAIAIVLGALLLLAAIAVVSLFTMDLGRFKDDLAALASDYLQLELRIDGPMHVHLGRDISISVEQASLRAPDWSTEPLLASLSRAEARVELRSLWRWPIRIHAGHIEGARLFLETDEDGRYNFDILPVSEDSPDTSDEPFSMPVELDGITLSDAHIQWRTPRRELPWSLRIDSAEERLASDGAYLETQGALNDTPLRLNVAMRPLSALQNLRDVKLEADGELGLIELDGAVSLADLLAPKRPEARLNITGPSLEYLTDKLKLQRISTGPLDVQIRVVPSEQRMQLTSNAVFGEFRIGAEGLFENLASLQEAELRFTASGPDASHVGELLNLPGIPGDPFSLQGEVQRSDYEIDVTESRLTLGRAQVELAAHLDDFRVPRGAELKLHLTGPDLSRFSQLLGLPGRLDGEFGLRAEVKPKPGGADVDLTGFSSGIELTGNGELIDAPQWVGSHLTARLTGPSLVPVGIALDLDGLPAGAFDTHFDIELTPTGYQLTESRLQLADDVLVVDGLVGTFPELVGTRLDLQLEAPNLRGTLQAMNMPTEQVPKGALQVTGGVELKDSGWHVTTTQARLGDLALTASGTLGDLAARTGSALALQLSGPSLAAHLPIEDERLDLNRPFELGAVVSLDAAELQLRELAFTIDNAAIKGTADLTLDPPLQSGKFTVSARSPDLLWALPQAERSRGFDKAPLELNARGSWREPMITIEQLSMNLGESRLRVQGTLEGPPAFDDTELRFVTQVPDASRYSTLVGRDLPAESVALSFLLEGRGDTITLKNLNFTSGQSDLSGSLLYRSGEQPHYQADLQSKVLDLSPWLEVPEAETPTEPPPPIEEEAPPPADPDTVERLIPDTPVRLAWFAGYTANIDVQIGRLLFDARHMSDVNIKAHVLDGAGVLQQLSYVGERNGRMQVQAGVRPDGDNARLGIRVSGSELSLALPNFSVEDVNQMPHQDVEMVLVGYGKTTREVFAGMDGYFSLIGGPGRIKAGALSVLTNDFFEQLLRTINPFSASDPYTNVECMTILAGIEDGLLTGDPLYVMQSERLNVFSNAKINLDTEKIDVNFHTVPQKGLGFSLSTLVNPYVKVIGTLGRPMLSLNPEQTVIQGGAAVATGGLSILALGFKDRFLSSKDPCGDAIEKMKPRIEALHAKYNVKASK